MDSYYVYVYIDPRNYEEFYYGKGKGSRKYAHLAEESDSEKSRRISLITKAGLKPIIRVIARELSEHDALLIEKTLLWKLGRQLTNVSSGHYANNFRPHDTLHIELSGFDYHSGLYYYNVGEGTHRNWDDYRKYGFISAGHGIRWRDAMREFRPGDVVAAYLKRHGFVGVGKVREPARPAREVMLNGKPLLHHSLVCSGLGKNAESDELSEFVATVEWIRAVDRSAAKWKSKSQLYTTPLIRASLDGQPDTIEFLEKEFDLSLRDLVR
jgi:uncharacterized protein